MVEAKKKLKSNINMLPEKLNWKRQKQMTQGIHWENDSSAIYGFK